MTSDEVRKIRDAADATYQSIMGQREMIVRAFIAETGMHPSEIMQVEEDTETGRVWYLRRREKDDDRKT